MPIQKLTSYVGLSKQASKGAAGSTPATFGFGVLDGKVFTADVTQDLETQTLNSAASDRFGVAVTRTGIQPGASFRTRAWIRTIGAFLMGALGTDTPSGAGPYTHAITPAMTLPYWTLFSRYGSTEYEKLSDCVFDEVTVSWSEREALEVECNLKGITPTFGAGGAWTATADESVATYVQPVVERSTSDVGSSTPAAAQVKGASVHIANNVDGIPALRNPSCRMTCSKPAK